MIEFDVEEEKRTLGAAIRVMGIGGGGGNAVNAMVGSDLGGVKFIAANTDAQVLNVSKADIKLQLGDKITKGLGAGSNPDVGRRAAEEDLCVIIDAITDADILFLTAGMGGGTGTGATPVIARAARELGVLTVAVVTKPFLFEGRKRMRQAEEAIDILSKDVDTLIVIPNQKLLDITQPNISMLSAFAMVNDVLKQAIKGVVDIIVKSGHINVDFADVRTIMKGMGRAIMGTGKASGEDRARQAALAAISSPLLEDVNIDGARGVLINITGSENLTLQEINDAANLIYESASDDADIILGSVIDPSMGDEIMVTVIATGFDGKQKEESVSVQPTIKRDNSFKVKQSTSNVITKTLQGGVPAKKLSVVENEESQENELEEDIFQEEKSEQILASSRSVESVSTLDLDDIDTPTFLRKKFGSEKDKNV